jgi:hypothetical protein
MRFALQYALAVLAPLAAPALAWSGQQPSQHNSSAPDRAVEHDAYRYRVMEVRNGPNIDGDLSDPVWTEAAILDGFVQQEPATGAPATERTEVRLLRDKESLYLAITCFDSDPERIVRNVLRFRDDSVWMKDDVVRVVLDTFHDHRRGYVFSINPLGAKQDAQVDNQEWNSNWDEVWNVKTRALENGWSVEISLPFRVLRFPTGGDGRWGFNVIRSIKRKNETSSWAPLPAGQPLTRNEFHGHLEGMAGLVPGRNLQFIPYSLLGWAQSSGAGSSTRGEFGGDLKYSLTSSLSLDATYNTNFAQVEVDEQQVNLTRFSLRFPEKREFFLENAQLFQFGDQDIDIFFSRRIGLANREPVPILGGARLSGRLGAFDLGLLSTETDRQGELPRTNYSAGRLRWNLGGRSYLGGILTSVASRDGRNLAFGPDALIWLTRNLWWEGYLAATDDLEQVGRKLAYSTLFHYNTDLLEINLGTASVADQFEPALGFVQRDDLRRHSGWIRRGYRLNHAVSRKIDFLANFSYLTDQQGSLETREIGFEAINQLDSGDTVRYEWKRLFENLPIHKPFEINSEEGIVVAPGAYAFSRMELGFNGFSGRAMVPGIELETGEFFSGRRTAVNLSNIWRASPHLLLEGDYEFNDVSLAEGSFQTHLWRGRVSVPLTARMTADGFLQWNSLDDTFSTQLRFHLIYGRDSNLFAVYTDVRRDGETGSAPRDRAVQIKLTYRLYQ